MKYLKRSVKKIPAKFPGEKATYETKWKVMPNPELFSTGVLERKTFDNREDAVEYLNRSRNHIAAYYNQSTVDGAIERIIEGKFIDYLSPMTRKNVINKFNIIRNLKLFGNKRFGKRTLGSINENTFTVINNIFKDTCSVAEHRKRKYSLSILCEYLVQQGWIDKNYMKEFRVKSLPKEFKPQRSIPEDHMDNILSVLFSNFSTRSSGMFVLIMYDSGVEIDSRYVWEDLELLDLSEPTKETIEDHKKDWSFQRYVFPKIETEGGEYVPMSEKTIANHFNQACEYFKYNYKFKEIIND